MATRRSEQWVQSAQTLADAPKSANARSLLTRAVYLLSRREYSRAELGRKLAQPSMRQRAEQFKSRSQKNSKETHENRLHDNFMRDNSPHNAVITQPSDAAALGLAPPLDELTDELATGFTPPTEAELDTVLEQLTRMGYLDDARFVRSLVHRKSARMGTARVMMDLAPHKIDAAHSAEIATQLKQTELERCYQTWAQRFANRALSPLDVDTTGQDATVDDSMLADQKIDFTAQQKAQAKQGRYLISRGFNSDAVRRVLKGWKPESEV